MATSNKGPGYDRHPYSLELDMINLIKVKRQSPGFRSLSNGKVTLDINYYPGGDDYDQGTRIFAR